MYNFFCVFLILLSSTAFSQVINNNIENRLPLKIDSLPFHSNTTNCTVQWNCVDTKAVNGCIKFHNDQWFEFTTGPAGRYFLTVTNQNCRDVRGVQVLVIDGTPCEPATYKHISCYSTGAQDDIALMLESPQANRTYLVNIDGYLNDFCGFDISITTKEPVFAQFPLQTQLPLTSQLKDSLVHFTWSLPDSIQEDFTEFSILRRHATQKKSQEINRFPAIANAYGERQQTYTYTDTLRQKGVYTYKIIGADSKQRQYLIKELNIHFSPMPAASANPLDVLVVDLPVRKKLNLHVLLFNAQTDELLKKGYILTSARNKNKVNIDVARFREQGIHQFKVVIKEMDNPEGYEKSFQISQE